MAPTSEDVYKVLQSIDSRLQALNQHFGAGIVHGAAQTPQGQGSVPAVASDRDLDSQYGNPEVKAKDPRDWTGDTMKGKRFSECPPEYLDLVASRLDYFASQTEGSQDHEEQKKRRYNLIDASRARGWAARKRAGWTPPPEEPSAFGTTADPALTADEIPFLWLLPALFVLHAASSWLV